MPPGLDALKHIVVLMMENRSFDHMLGSLKAVNAQIDGVDRPAIEPRHPGQPGFVAAARRVPEPTRPRSRSSFPGRRSADLQRRPGPSRVANMQGFVKSYFKQQQDVAHSQKIMYYFTQDKLPVLTSLALNFAVFNRWFASIPGPTICNRAFAHYGTSFGQVGMNIFYPKARASTNGSRTPAAPPSSITSIRPAPRMEVVNLLQHQPQLFGTYDQFLADCKSGTLSGLQFRRAQLYGPRQR